jgi:hypothetical protein
MVAGLMVGDLAAVMEIFIIIGVIVMIVYVWLEGPAADRPIPPHTPRFPYGNPCPRCGATNKRIDGGVCHDYGR